MVVSRPHEPLVADSGFAGILHDNIAVSCCRAEHMAKRNSKFVQLHVGEDKLSHKLDLKLAVLCKSDLEQIFKRAGFEVTPVDWQENLTTKPRANWICSI